MKRLPPKRTVADRLLQNVSGIRFELEQMRKTAQEAASLFSGNELLLIERALEKLEAESEKLTSLLREADESADPFRIAG